MDPLRDHLCWTEGDPHKSILTDITPMAKTYPYHCRPPLGNMNQLHFLLLITLLLRPHKTSIDSNGSINGQAFTMKTGRI